MKLVLLFGPQAVGKMTVGQELEKATELKLFHNHMSIEFLQPYFGFTPEMWDLSNLLRKEFFEAYSKTDNYGLIFTFVWAFNQKEDWNLVEAVVDTFESNGGEVYFVELEADLVERLKRNKTPNRLDHKPSKRNIEQSEQRLVASLDSLRLTSNEGEVVRDNYIKINNNQLKANDVALKVKSEFKL
ncbi:AAA family ATPase [Halobacillus litoralis]|uniref:Shikimate kinase n=1 Tax=Halobacillus litoralis TaxID=45668 RepID=A0A410M9T1_9BACI|nr:AAA family ATPase [Halobacillus litoralis]QAS51428.1 shikimate kinase [Halobacillus litoralis]